MKYLILGLFFFLGGCQKSVDMIDPCAELIVCTDECIFAIEEKQAVTMFLGCYNSWGVMYQDEDRVIGLIVDDVDSQFQNDSLEVKICGYARTNEIPLQFPDPFFNEIYQFEVVMMEIN